MKKRLISVALFLGVVSVVQADDYVFDFGVGHSFVDFMWDSERNIDDDAAKLLLGAYNVNEEWSAELFYADLDTKMHDTGVSVSSNQIGLKGLYHLLDRRSTIVPYLGFGLTELELDGGAYDRFTETGLVFVAGLKLNLSDRVAMRLEANINRFEESHSNGELLWVGFTMGFGGAKKSSAPIVIQAKPPVNDPVITVEPTTAPAPADSDHDGVIDDQDKCSGTPSGLNVNAQGCATLTEKVSIQLNVTFDSGKSEVKSSFADEINKVVTFMTQYPSSKVIIEGHTDASGDDKKNKVLSQRRADAVAASIVTAGVAADRVSAVGYGEEKPLADNASADGRAQNRRVTAEIEEQVTTTK